jgi:cytochrome c biogenesis protein CcmG, thiol:disulfide interchange protein DsbE
MSTGTREIDSASSLTPTPAADSAPGKLSGRERWVRLALVAVVALSIVGGAWALAGRAGLEEVGTGGVNAGLLPKVGEPVPELVTYDVEGNLVRLSDLRGQPVWLNFWGSWCAPCRAEMPDLQAAYAEMAPKGVVMLAVSIRETPQQARDYARLNGATFPILADPSLFPPSQFPEVAATADRWEIRNFPTHLFVDAEGIVRAVVITPMDRATAVGYGEQILS